MKYIIALLLLMPSYVLAAEISGEVSFAKGASLNPGGILFIFAKKDGNPMPVAVGSKNVKIEMKAK